MHECVVICIVVLVNPILRTCWELENVFDNACEEVGTAALEYVCTCYL